MNNKNGIRLAASMFAFIFILSCGEAQECLSPSWYTGGDNFYYLESPRETNRHAFRYEGYDRSRGYYDPRFSGMSSYQGTTTGPGPNGCYPGSPRGFYNVNEDSSTRPHFSQKLK